MTSIREQRIPNLALRNARRSMNLTQAQFAQAIRTTGNAIGTPNACSKRLVQKWETGEHAGCHRHYLKALQAVTGLPAQDLGFRRLPYESGLTITASDYKEGADASSENQVMDRLRHALNHPATVDSRTVDLAEMGTERLFQLEHHSPARLLAPTVQRHLSTLTAQMNAARTEEARRRLTIAAGTALLLAGWLAFDRGDTLTANRLWDEAITAATKTTDHALFAACLTYQSYAAAQRHDPESAWQLAHDASQLTPDDPRATAWATSRAARHAAQLGRHDAASTALHRSLEIGHEMPITTPGDGSKPWTRSFDLATLLATSAHTAAILGDPNATDYATHAVNALNPAKVKARALVLAEATYTAARLGELKLCLEYASEAATLTRETETSLASGLLHEVVNLVMPHSDTRSARKLLAQLAQTAPEDTPDAHDETQPDQQTPTT